MEGLNPYNDNLSMPFEKLTKVKGDPIRHIEQLWDEVKNLKERVLKLEVQEMKK